MLDKNLNLVQQVGDLSVHHQLVDYNCFKQNYRLINKIGMQIIRDDSMLLMPKTALFALNDAAGHDIDLSRAKPSDIETIETNDKRQLEKDIAFLGEIKRMTNVVTPSNGNYEPLPLVQALQANIITDEQFDNVLSSVIFFIVMTYTDLANPERIQWVLKNYGSQTTSLNCMEWINSLPKLTQDAPTAKKKV
jgi:hypothetical protein